MPDPTLDELRAKGYTIGTPEGFCGITDEVRRQADEQRRKHRQVAELRVRIGSEVRRRRAEARLEPAGLADRLRTKPARVMRIEGGKPGVSLDALLAAYLATGGTIAEFGAFIAATAAH